jgi:anti-anti-sigma factor
MSTLDPFLRIDAAQQADAYVIRIEGELDLAGCPELDSALADAERSEADRILVDLDRLSSIDAGGLQALLRASRRSASNGDRLRVTRGRGEVARTFRLTMLDVTLPFTERPRVSKLGESLSAECLRLQEEARLARTRFQRYKARTYGPRLTDPARLFQLERGFLMAENRLRRANPAGPAG